MDTIPPAAETFDFDSHSRTSLEEYQKLRPLYSDFSDTVLSILTRAFNNANIKPHSIQARAKTPESFVGKVLKRSKANPELPRYDKPLQQITDLAGIRVITYFLRTLEEVDGIIESEFIVDEKINKSAILEQEDRFGYQSIHYIIRFRDNRLALPEYVRFRNVVAEIQVRTILQHTWAEIEHDIQYKSAEVIPSVIRRRFAALAGLLEIADREFQAIQKEDNTLRQEARESVQEGNFEQVEITPDALKAYLDKKLDPDGRVSDWSYDFTARQLRRLGFTNFQQVDDCIAAYDHELISRILWGKRMGQVTRFEDQVLAGMGENYVEEHGWGHEDWFVDICYGKMEQLKKAGIQIGDYDPSEQNA